MATYRNSTKGARAVHLTNGTYKLVEPGASITVEDGKIKRLAPGLVRAKKGDLPDPPADLAAAVADEKPISKMNKAELIAKAGMTEAEAEGLTKADLIAKLQG